MSENILQLASQLTKIFVPVIIVIGVFSNLLNIIILTRPALIHHACSLYFLALAITNLFYSSFLLVFNLLADGYQLDPTQHSSLLCKMISYLLNLCPQLSVYLIVFASIDRYYGSSINAQTRQLSNRRRACWTIGLVILVLSIFFIGALITFDTTSVQSPSCTIRSDIVFNQVFLILVLISYVIIAPFSMMFFGCLTIYNRRQTLFLPTRLSHYRRTEGQLSRMLLLQVGTHIILVLPFCITFFMLILPVPVRFTVNFTGAYVICKLPFYLTSTTAFFLYVLSARVYRAELFRLYKKLFQMHRTIQPRTIQSISIPLNTTVLRSSKQY